MLCGQMSKTKKNKNNIVTNSIKILKIAHFKKYLKNKHNIVNQPLNTNSKTGNYKETKWNSFIAISYSDIGFPNRSEKGIVYKE